MATITFKAKVEQVMQSDGTGLAYEIIRVPVFERRHCDTPAFRSHPWFGGIANSDLFPNALKRVRHDMGVRDYNPFIRLDRLPDNVAVNRGGFLATVTVTV